MILKIIIESVEDIDRSESLGIDIPVESKEVEINIKDDAILAIWVEDDDIGNKEFIHLYIPGNHFMLNYTEFIYNKLKKLIDGRMDHCTR